VAELRPVAGPSSPVLRHVRRLIIVLVLGLLVAIAKPWGTGIGPSTASAPLPTVAPTPATTSTPAPVAGTYDFLAFGTNEPPPGWELWPAGRLASFTYAMRIDMAVVILPTAGPSAIGQAASPSPTPSPTAIGNPSAAGVPVSWPTIRVPSGNILDLIGINCPRGYTVHVTGLTRIEPDGSFTAVRALLGTSPWPDHFTTVGYAPDPTQDAMTPWPAGHFRLELTIDPGAVDRTLDIVIESPAPDASPEGSSPSPGVSAAP
jgi:hypothetical protein